MTRHYPDLGRASDWLKQISHAARPIRSSTQIWVETRHQYGISALVSQTSFRRETSGGVAKLACVASVSVRFRSKERGTRVKDRAKNGASKRAGRGWGRKEGNFLHLPLPPLSFFRSNFISRVAVPRFFFTPKPNGNACNAGYREIWADFSG